MGTKRGYWLLRYQSIFSRDSVGSSQEQTIDESSVNNSSAVSILSREGKARSSQTDTRTRRNRRSDNCSPQVISCINIHRKALEARVGNEIRPRKPYGRVIARILLVSSKRPSLHNRFLEMFNMEIWNAVKIRLSNYSVPPQDDPCTLTYADTLVLPCRVPASFKPNLISFLRLSDINFEICAVCKERSLALASSIRASSTPPLLVW